MLGWRASDQIVARCRSQSGPEARRLHQEVSLLDQARRPRRSELIGVDRAGRGLRSARERRTHRVPAVVVAEWVGERVEHAQPVRRTVHLRRPRRPGSAPRSALPINRSSMSYNIKISQPVRFGCRRRLESWIRRDRRLQLILSDRPRAIAASRTAMPSAMLPPGFPGNRSCSASGTRFPSAVIRAGRRASSRTSRARSPADLRIVGEQLVRAACQPDRLCRQIHAGRRIAANARVPWLYTR